MQRIRKSGPRGATRAFQPTVDIQGTMTTDEKIAEALEHIAVVLSAMDHNLEVLVERLSKK
jgi:hypothetical protein